ncbi:hypothetical protein TM239_31860 [Bradyrhizobium sp. TM239]|nr:hypothetical protein TM239_31860 [Bradyrhizobium sp. TM239]
MQDKNTDVVRLLIAEAIDDERKKVELKFIEQEHRTTHVLFNLYAHLRSKNPDLRGAAWKAFFWRFFVPRGVTVILATGGLLGILLTASGLILAFRANTLLERQTHRMDVQNMLTESQRRSAFLASELSSILTRLEAEQSEWKQHQAPQAEERLFTPTEVTIGRLVSLTLALRPYRPIEMETPSPDRVRRPKAYGRFAWLEWLADQLFPISDDADLYRFSDRLISPERGQLLLALIPQKLDFSALSRAGATFDYADLSNSTLHDVNLGAIQLRNADFTRASIEDSNLGNADLDYSIFVRTKITSSTLGPANEAEFSHVVLSNVDFTTRDGWNNNCQALGVTANYSPATVEKLLPMLGCRMLGMTLRDKESAEKLIALATNMDQFVVCIETAIEPTADPDKPSPTYPLYVFREKDMSCHSKNQLYPPIQDQK